MYVYFFGEAIKTVIDYKDHMYLVFRPREISGLAIDCPFPRLVLLAPGKRVIDCMID
jgi:hypothetical protein